MKRTEKVYSLWMLTSTSERFQEAQSMEWKKFVQSSPPPSSCGMRGGIKGNNEERKKLNKGKKNCYANLIANYRSFGAAASKEREESLRKENQ